MAKDYFQDIVPPDAPGRSMKPPVKKSVPPPPPPPAQPEEVDEEQDPQGAANRSIRDIAPSRTRMRLTERESFGAPQKPGAKRWGVWAIAAVAIVIVGALGLFAFRKSSVDVTPRSQVITFDPATAHFSASSLGSAATGTLPYTIFTADVEDSEPVTAQGLQHTETKASGSLTVYNNYSTQSVKLIKNTRFESSGGLIYKIPAEVVVPGKSGSKPGSVTVTVAADQAGDQYNIAPGRFTVPGLKSSAAMYSGVYAVSDAQFSGGFLGDQPAVDPSTLATAISAVRGRLSQKVGDVMQSHDGYITFPDLTAVTYQSLPSTTEAGGAVRIHEKAHIQIAAFPVDQFTRTLARTVVADADTSSINLIQKDGFGVHLETPASSLSAGSFDFTVSGAAQFVWNVDAAALASALAGRDQSAFQTVITGFPGVQEAHARIEPFWKSSFPSDASKITIRVQAPPSGQ